MLKTVAAASLIVALGSGGAWAEDDGITFESCRVCHGPAGQDSSIPPIQGRPFPDLLGMLSAFSTDAIKSTIMHRFLVGEPESNLESLARFISQIKDPAQ